MLCHAKRIHVLSIVLTCCTGLVEDVEAIPALQLNWENTTTVYSPLNMGNIVKNLLDSIDSAEEWNEHISAALVFAQFLIKQKINVHRELTEVDDSGKNLYFELLDKISVIREKIIKSFDVHNLEALLDQNLLYADVTLRADQIDKHLNYSSLVRDYATKQGTGFPNSSFSNLCILHIHGREHCQRVRQPCIAALHPSTPLFGYQRMHQVLQVYLLMHHVCARLIGSQLYFEILATEHCSQVYREHRVIRALNTEDWRDLYIEQSAICSLFGFTEFFNTLELQNILSWENDALCSCIKPPNPLDTFRSVCRCADHQHSAALVLYVNAFLNLE